MSELREALTAANVSALVQKQIDPALLEYQRRYSPLVRALPAKQWGSTTYYFNQRTTRLSGGFVTDGGANSVATSTYAQNSFGIKLLQSVGSVTGYAQAVTRDLVGDLKAMEVEGAVQSLLWDIEAGILWGDAGATASGVQPQFDGLDKLVATFSGASQNAIDEASAALSLSHLDNLIDLVEENAAMPTTGNDWMLLMSPKANSKVASLLTAQQRYQTVEVATGLNVLSYRDIPIVKSSMLAARGNQTSITSVAASSTGGAIASSTTTFYAVSAIVARFGEIAACTASSITTGSSTNTNAAVITVPTQTGMPDSASPISYKVWSGTASSAASLTLLGTVDAFDTGGTAVTTIVDTGTNLLTNTSAKTGPAAYQNGNSGAHPRGTTDEGVYLIPRNPDFCVRPFVRDIQVINLSPTTSAPDTLPFALVSDTTLAVRGPKYVGRLTRVVASI